MPEENPTGRCSVWIILAFLFISVFSGGVLLVLYLYQPESPSTSWYPVVGILLVCLPWFFWFITFSYRLISRKYGFRMVCWGTDIYPIDGTDMGGGGSFASHNGNVTGHREAQSSIDAKNGGSTGEAGLGSGNAKRQSSGEARSSHESETPLKLSMAS